MPEFPDLEVYLDALRSRIEGEVLRSLRIQHAFLLRSVAPPPQDLEERRVTALSRLGKRLVWELEGERFALLHLMIAGRLQWRNPGAKIPRKQGLAAFDFDSGTVLLTEAGCKRRASLHLVLGSGGLAEHDRGGLEIFETDLGTFSARLSESRHTLKRALTDPGILAGIGNAYSDEILHEARMSPFRRTYDLDDRELEELFRACRHVLGAWKQRLSEEAAGRFPAKVTAFHEDMAVHGRFRKPCPRCGAPVQRIAYAEREANYCARCQTGGRVLADRLLSKLLKDDWPRRIEQLEG